MCLLAACCVVPAVGQDWKEALKSAASNVVDKATGGKATETLMIGDWQYEAPGVKLESDNALADVGASAVTGKMEEQLEKLYALAGIRAGACKFSFAADKRFTATFGSRTFTGTYEFHGREPRYRAAFRNVVEIRSGDAQRQDLLVGNRPANPLSGYAAAENGRRAGAETRFVQHDGRDGQHAGRQVRRSLSGIRIYEAMTMRRLFLIAAFAAAFATPVSAQSWQDMFKSAIQSLTGGTSSESAAATAAPEPLPEKELFGSWSYQAPAMEYTGDDMLASLAASTLKGQLPSYFQQAGLQPGKATVSFSRRGVFKAVLDTHKVEGVYRYDEDTGELTVECLFAGNPVSFTGRAKHADGVLTLLFEANAALGSLRASSQQYAQNPKLQQIAAILERYPGVMLGAELKRR